MQYKLYKDKSSVLNKYTRQLQGGDIDVNATSLGWWERRTDIKTDQYDDIEIILDMRFHKRPDMLSYVLYGKDNLEWVILQYNNIVDINEEFVVGKTIKAPHPNRIQNEIITNTVKYQKL